MFMLIDFSLLCMKLIVLFWRDIMCENPTEMGMWTRKVGIYLAIQIWSLKTAVAFSNKVTLLNRGISLGRYWKHQPLELFLLCFSYVRIFINLSTSTSETKEPLIYIMYV